MSNVRKRAVHIFSNEMFCYVAVEEGCGVYRGCKGSNAAGGAADVSRGEQGQQQRQTTDRYTHTTTINPTTSALIKRYCTVTVLHISSIYF